MTREKCKELLPIMAAYAECKEIECRRLGGGGVWREIFGVVIWDDESEYRIKPSPREWWIKQTKQDWYVLTYKPDAAFNYIHVREVLE